VTLAAKAHERDRGARVGDREILARHYGTTFVPSREPVLKAKYDLTLIGE
jgi:hypothetical protein